LTDSTQGQPVETGCPFFFYLLSGATALVYETCDSLVLGHLWNTAQALSTVIAVFLGGSRFGALLSGG